MNKDKTLYKPFKSKAKNKKYSVYVQSEYGKPKLIHFGDTRYQHYRDRFGAYTHLNHNDTDRRKRYLSRAKGIKNKKGELTYLNKNSPTYWSVKYLW